MGNENMLSFEECIEELLKIIRDKDRCSTSERLKAIGMLIGLKNDTLENQKNADNSLNITIDYGDDIGN